MAERPILFSGPMIRAILDGRKTQTRRVLKLPKWASEVDEFAGSNCTLISRETGCTREWSPPYAAGDHLWVREAWRTIGNKPRSECTGPEDLEFRATTGEAAEALFRWVPGLLMPRWASRLTLEVTDVRVHRLQEITRADALAEGVEMESADPPFYYVPGIWPHSLTAVGIEEPGGRHAERSFAKLWDSINGTRAAGAFAWAVNPWVAALALTLLPALAFAQPVPPGKPVLVTVTHVRDGDTFEATLPDGLAEVFRVAGVDAAEAHARCPYEDRLAEDATAMLSTELAAAPGRVRVVPLFRERGKTGRMIAEVLVDGRDVGRALYASGIVRLWAGRRRGWCR